MLALRRWLALLAAVSVLGSAGHAHQKPQEKLKPAVQVSLRFSVSELDPQDPKDSFVECVVRNNTDKPIKLPAAYVMGFDREMVLKGDAPGFGWGLWLVAWGGEAKPRYEMLEPGKELSVFKAPLKELLLSDRGRSKVAWTWEA